MIRRSTPIYKFTFLIIIIGFLSTSCFVVPGKQSQAISETIEKQATATIATDTVVTPSSVVAPTQTVFMPIVTKRPADKFFGIYFKKYWTDQSVMATMPAVDQAAGKKHSSVGWFINLEDDAFTIPVTDLSHNNLFRQLEALWKAGYISFVNVGSNATARQIINGERDQDIQYLAEFYKSWLTLGQGRQAMIAPLQEMNGDWTTYGKVSTSEEIKQAYRHIVDIFDQKGIGRNQVMWVFAPNGWNDPTKPERAFENYYPGDDVVDIVGFSSYNYGFCPATAGTSAKWESYSQIFEPYIDRMHTMASSKPVIVAETATTGYYDYNVSDPSRKDQWFIENYNSLANNPSVIGVYYFSFSEFDGYSCDFEINPKGVFSSGYRSGLANPVYRYLSPQELGNTIQ